MTEALAFMARYKELKKKFYDQSQRRSDTQTRDESRWADVRLQKAVEKEEKFTKAPAKNPRKPREIEMPDSAIIEPILDRVALQFNTPRDLVANTAKVGGLTKYTLVERKASLEARAQLCRTLVDECGLEAAQITLYFGWYRWMAAQMYKLADPAELAAWRDKMNRDSKRRYWREHERIAAMRMASEKRLRDLRRASASSSESPKVTVSVSSK
jgi:hypothetical protein